MGSKYRPQVVGAACFLLVSAYSPDALADKYKFCFRHPVEQYYDLSPHVFAAGGCTTNADCDEVKKNNTNDPLLGTCTAEGCSYDFGEDLARNNGGPGWKMRKISVQVNDATGPVLWTGNVSVQGCTGIINTNADRFNFYITPIYVNSNTGFTFTVRECPQGSNCSLPLYAILDYDPNPSQTTWKVILPQATPLNAYAPAAYVVERFMGTKYQGAQPLRRFEIYHTGQGSQGGFTNTIWNGFYPVLRVEKTATRRKFNIAHELGHVFQLDQTRDSHFNLLDCSYGPGDASNHSIDNPEFASCANIEGFAHYVAAASFNWLPVNGYGYWVTGGTTADSFRQWNAEQGTDELSNHCSGNDCDGLGTEYDWARQWWDFQTNSGTRPSNSDLLDIIDEAYPWYLTGTDWLSHYLAFLQAVIDTQPAGMDARFNSLAAANGVFH